MGIADAAYEEITPAPSHLVSSKMACPLAGICESITFDPEHGSIMRMGGYSLWKNSAAATDWRQTIDRNSRPVREQRVVELRDHPFFVATLFLLQLSAHSCVALRK
jgi:hypothetical protein